MKNRVTVFFTGFVSAILMIFVIGFFTVMKKMWVEC